MIPRYKEIVDLIKKGSTLEAQEKIIELRESALELQEENQQLKIRVAELESQAKIEPELVYEKPAYWRVLDSSRDGPFCQKCWDSDSLLIRLQGGENDQWHCCQCKSSYRGPNYVFPGRRSTRTRGT